MPEELPVLSPDSPAVDSGMPPLFAGQDRLRRSDVPVSAPAYAKTVELLSWTAPSRVFDPKNVTWFLGLFAVGLGLIVLFAILRDVILILLVGAVIFVVYAMHRVEPPEIENRILSTGVETAGRLYSWKDLHSFTILQGNPPRVRLETTLHFPHLVELQVEDEGLDQIEHLLLPHLPHQEKESSGEGGAMVDQTLISLANILPGRNKMLAWLERRIS